MEQKMVEQRYVYVIYFLGGTKVYFSNIFFGWLLISLTDGSIWHCLQILSLDMISCICNDWWTVNGYKYDLYSYDIPFIWMLSALIVPRYGRSLARPSLWGTNPRPRWWWTGLSLWDLWLEVRCQIYSNIFKYIHNHLRIYGGPVYHYETCDWK